MSNEKNETIADIVREMRNDMPRVIDAKVILRNYADRIEAAYKRMEDSIHRAMVLNVGIEMEDFRNPPRLSTALDDIYYALSDALGIRDALGTDGYVSADIEEAKAIGRHFVIKWYGNAAEMREMLDEANRKLSALMNNHITFTVDGKEYYQPFLSRDVKEISSILRGNAGTKEEK